MDVKKTAHLLGGLYFWGKVTTKLFKLDEKDYKNEKKNIRLMQEV